MAYLATGFSTVAASKAGVSPSVYAYKTVDALADVNTAGYFNALATILSVGDLIYGVTSVGTTAVAALYYVRSNASGVVDLTDGTVLANTNTD
jgi:hypothetical protein